MQVLIIGGGGREHALAWKAARSPRVARVYVAPGNAGTALEPGVENLPLDAGAEGGIEALLAFARERSVGLTIVGPEQPLVAGLVDRFEDAGLRCFGPRQAPARLEGSKSFSKDFFARHGIPSARYRSFTEVAPALDYLRAEGAPIVVKADGLAAGKGVVVAQRLEDAERAVTTMLSGGAFGAAGRRIVVEECLQGEEASFIVLADGERCLPLATSQDHKARDDGDRGPNTGGMGAYSPAPVIDRVLHGRVMREVIEPTLRGLASDGCHYRGFLYAGLMIDANGAPKVLEFNCRLGDPETQPIMLRLESDLVELCLAACEGRLDGMSIDWNPQPALGVVMAAEGYPGSYRRGDAIGGLPAADESSGRVKVFHAGTRRDPDSGEVVTAGGRVLCVTASGDDLGEARRRAYEQVRQIHWRGAFYRRDIGHRALARGG